MEINTDQINQLVEQIEGKGQTKVSWYGAQNSEDVDECEHLLGKTLPPSLRQFLESYGGGGIRDQELSGVIPEQSLDAEGTLIGDTFRIAEEFGLPQTFVVICVLDDEAVWCVDYTHEADADGELPIVTFDLVGYSEAGDEWISKPVHGSFGNFLIEYLGAANQVFEF